MATQNELSRIYALKTAGVDKVMADINSLIHGFEMLGKAKNAAMSATTNGGDTEAIAKVNEQLTKQTKIQLEALENLKKLNAATAEGAKVQSEMAANLGKVAEVQKGVNISMQESAASMGNNLTAATHGVIQVQSEMGNTFKRTQVIAQGFTDTLQRNVEGFLDAKAAIEGLTLNLAWNKEKFEEGTISGEKYDAMLKETTVELKRATVDLKLYENAITNEIKAQDLSSKASKVATEETIRNKMAVSEQNAELKKKIQLEQTTANSIAEARVQSQMMRTELNNLNLATAEGVTRQKELVAALEEKDAWIKANVDKYSAQKINIGNYPETFAQLEGLTGEMEKMKAAGMETSAEFQALSAKADQLRTSMGGVQAEMTMIKKTMQEMIAAGKEDEAELAALAERYGQLKQVIASTNSTIAGSTNATTTASQQLGVMKARMIELSVAGQAEGAEFKMLSLQAKELTAAIETATVAMAEQATIMERIIARLETMGLRMFIHLAIIGVVISAATSLYEWWTKDAKAAEELKKSLADLESTAQANGAKEIARLQVVAKVAQDAAQSMDTRLKAVKELQDNSPEYFATLTKEKILYGDITEALHQATEALLTKARAEASMNQLQELAAKDNELAIEQIKLKKQATDQLLASQRAQKAFEAAGLSASDSRIMSAQGRVEAEAIATRILDNTIAKVKKQREDLAEQMKMFADIAQQNAPGLFGKKDDDTKVKSTADSDLRLQFQAEKELQEAILLYMKQHATIDAEQQKAIMDNTERSLQERLAAYERYYQDINKISRLERDAAISIELAKQNELQQKLDLNGKAGGTKLSSRAVDATRKEIEASQTKVLGLEEKGAADVAHVTRESATKRLNIIKTSLEEMYKAGESAYQLKKNRDAEFFLDDMVALKEMYDSKEISLEEYQNRVKNMQQVFNLQTEQDDIAHYRKLLASDKLTAEERIEVQKKLTAALLKEANDAKGSDKGLESQKRLKEQIANEAIDLAHTVANEVIHQQELTDAAKERSAQRNLDWTKKVSAAQVQSKKEQLANEKAFDNAQKQMEHEKMERDRKRAIAQMAIEYAVAALKIVAANISSGPTGWAIAAAEEATLAATYAVKIGFLASAPTYAQGTDYHPGGMAVVGDGGEKELVQIGNQYFISPATATAVNMPAGATVTPFSNIPDISRSSTFPGMQLKAPVFSSPSHSGVRAGNSDNGMAGIAEAFAHIHGAMATVMQGVQHIQVGLDTHKLGAAMTNNSYKKVKL